ncbi:MAG: hypothetical protein IT210_14105 [Armatimonadetes bacterium]|nr:hypothetical protein [Armatimonadota bacterium]
MRKAIFWILCLLAVALALTLAFAQEKEAPKTESGVILTALPLNQPAPTFDVTNVATDETKCYL